MLEFLTIGILQFIFVIHLLKIRLILINFLRILSKIFDLILGLFIALIVLWDLWIIEMILIHI